jgi:hypothetical protein
MCFSSSRFWSCGLTMAALFHVYQCVVVGGDVVLFSRVGFGFGAAKCVSCGALMAPVVALNIGRRADPNWARPCGPASADNNLRPACLSATTVGAAVEPRDGSIGAGAPLKRARARRPTST